MIGSYLLQGHDTHFPPHNLWHDCLKKIKIYIHQSYQEKHFTVWSISGNLLWKKNIEQIRKSNFILPFIVEVFFSAKEEFLK